MRSPPWDKLIDAVDRVLPLAERMFDDLHRMTGDGEGVTRASYGQGEQIGHDLMRAAAEDAGLQVGTDAAGNLYATLSGKDRGLPRWVTGSHFDSVPCGGNFDGAAGAVASLAALVALQKLDLEPQRDISAMAIRAEECSSWFTGRHGGHLGSRAALGLLDAAELDSAMHVATNLSLAKCIDSAGFDSEAVRYASPPLSCANVCGFIELHIEQGPVLIEAGAAIGIVTGIRGTIRVRNGKCIGSYSHSGAVPQRMRRDAVLATAELISRIEEHCCELLAAGQDIVFAVGRLHTDAAVDSLTKVAGEVSFTIDVRSQDPSILQRFQPRLDQLASEIGKRRNVVFDFGGRAMAHPATMDSALRDLLTKSASALGIDAPEVPSGAGHDAAEFVRAGIPSGMIFVRNTGESHNPSEQMNTADFRQGLVLLTGFLAAVS